MDKTIAVIASFDTKGEESLFLKERIEAAGARAFMLDVSVSGNASFQPDISSEEIIRSVGWTKDKLRSVPIQDALNQVCAGAAKTVAELCQQGKIHGAISIGGGQGTLIGMSCMRALPVGFPKIQVSTLAGLPYRQDVFAKANDTLIMSSIVDVAGCNSILKTVLANAAAAAVGMAQHSTNFAAKTRETKRIAFSMFGVTTPCVSRVRHIFEQAGYEALVFVANQVSGEMMEDMISRGLIDAVADITPSELSRSYIEDGDTSAGMGKRLEQAGKAGLPMLVVPGAMDVCLLTKGTIESYPQKYPGRKLHMHNSKVAVMRTSKEENRILGTLTAQRLNLAKGSAVVVIPEGGFSRNDTPGNSLYDPEADEMFARALEENIRPDIPVVRLPYHINDPAFADAAAEQLLNIIK